MFKRIIVGLDGSAHARQALEIAAALAKNDHASLVLAHAMSDAPLSDSERRLAQTEYGMGELAELPAAGSVIETDANAGAGTPTVHERALDAALRVRAEFTQSLLQDARRVAVERGVEKVDLHSGTGDPARVILDLARSEKADLIVIGSRGLSDLEGLVFGSTSHKVTHLAPCSCLTVS